MKTNTQITQIITQVITAFEEYGSFSNEFRTVYYQNETLLNQHKTKVLKSNEGKPVVLTGILRRRGDGKDKNLNLISPAYVNGQIIEHLHVYDEVIDNAQVNKLTGNLIAENCKIYRFNRSSSQSQINGLGVKPIDCPFWASRNEVSAVKKPQTKVKAKTLFELALDKAQNK